MSDKRRIDVFISSTSFDLPEYRAAVVRVLNSKKLQPLGMEYWVVTGENPVALCKRQVSDAEIFIGIYAHRYGWCPDGYDGISITEMEYDWAGDVKRNGKLIPRLCFIMSDDYPLPETRKEKAKQAQINAFKTRVKSQQVGFFTTPDDLATQVALALDEVLHSDYAKQTPAKCILVPPPPDYFAGRTHDIDDLRQLLSGDKVIAVTALRGIGGMGKTTLVKALAHCSTDRFGLMLWAELGEQWNEALELSILQTWARELTGQEFPQDIPQKEIVNAVRTIVEQTAQDLCGEPILLIIDDVWPKTLHTARILRDAMPPGVRVLVTTRSDDVAIQLDSRIVVLEKLTPDEGAVLMAGLVNDMRADTSKLAELSVLLGGHPQSLQLVARQLRRNFQPSKIVEMIQKVRSGLDSGTDFADLKLDTGDTKLDSVSVTLSQTLRTLSEKRQKQFRALGILPTELNFHAAHAFALWNDEDHDGLDDLVVEGLLTPVIHSGDEYTQHRLLRAYARALLRHTDEFEVIHERHWKYLIERADHLFKQPPEEWKLLEDDLPQIHALGNELAAILAETTDPTTQDVKLHALSEKGATEFASDLLVACEDYTDSVCNYIHRRYIGEEGRRWLWMGLAAARTRNSQHRVQRFSADLGMWYQNRGESTTALDYYKQSLQESIALDNKRGQASTLNSIGLIHQDLGDRQRALAHFEQSLSLFIEIGDKRRQGSALGNIGAVYSAVGDRQRALEYYQQALSLFIEVNDKGGQGSSLNNIGRIHSAMGEKLRALEYYQQALQLRIDVGDLYGEAVTRGNMAVVLWRIDKRDEAIMQMKRARDLNAQIRLSTDYEDRWLHDWLRE